MLDVLTETSPNEEDDSLEEGAEAAGGKEIRDSESSRSKQVLRGRRTRYYDR
jgi:hypothetical protein